MSRMLLMPQRCNANNQRENDDAYEEALHTVKEAGENKGGEYQELITQIKENLVVAGFCTLRTNQATQKLPNNL